MSSLGGREQTARDFLNGVWFEHPLHPGFTDIPVGAWTVAFTLDTIGGDSTKRGADAAIAIGVLGAAGAAATGLADWRTPRNERVRRLGLAHAAMNTAAVTCYIASLGLRAIGARDTGKRISYLGYGIVSVSAYLGGHLMANERQGISYAPTQAEAPDEFLPVISETELADGTPRRVMAGALPVLVVRVGEQVYALMDQCTHLGCSLAAGKLEDEAIRCRCHGSRFNLSDGGVLQGPAAFPAPVLDVRVVDGHVQVRARADGRRL